MYSLKCDVAYKRVERKVIANVKEMIDNAVDIFNTCVLYRLVTISEGLYGEFKLLEYVDDYSHFTITVWPIDYPVVVIIFASR